MQKIITIAMLLISLNAISQKNDTAWMRYIDTSDISYFKCPYGYPHSYIPCIHFSEFEPFPSPEEYIRAYRKASACDKCRDSMRIKRLAGAKRTGIEKHREGVNVYTRVSVMGKWTGSRKIDYTQGGVSITATNDIINEETSRPVWMELKKDTLVISLDTLLLALTNKAAFIEVGGRKFKLEKSKAKVINAGKWSRYKYNGRISSYCMPELDSYDIESSRLRLWYHEADLVKYFRSYDSTERRKIKK